MIEIRENLFGCVENFQRVTAGESTSFWSKGCGANMRVAPRVYFP